MPNVHSLDDRQLIEIWSKITDPENLSDYEREIVAEMEDREIAPT